MVAKSGAPVIYLAFENIFLYLIFSTLHIIIMRAKFVHTKVLNELLKVG